MKWMRPIRIGGETTELFHIPLRASDACQSMHYLHTVCKKELKTIYNNWEIVEDPPVKLRCPHCSIAYQKKK